MSQYLRLIPSLFITLFSSQIFSQEFDFPLDAGEIPLDSYAVTTNGHYDLSLRRIDPTTGKWTKLKDAQNSSDKVAEDYLVYGVPVRASVSGVVVTCWRNAPDSPIPGPHPRRDKCLDNDGSRSCSTGPGCSCTIPRPGNHVQILTDDNILVNHAHLAPGTVPASICPHNSEYVADAEAKTWPNGHTEAYVETNQRVRIKAGQFLGLAGTSGASSGPHLHHDAKRYNPDSGAGNKVDIAYRTMHSQNIRPIQQPNAPVVNSEWRDRSGINLLNDKKIILENPYWIVDSYARHGIKSDSFKRDAARSERSGYEIVYFDAYSVKGTPYFNYLIGKSRKNIRLDRGLNSQKFQVAYDEHRSEGYVPISFEAYFSPDNQLRYGGLFKKGSGKVIAAHGVSLSKHRDTLARARDEGLTPVSIAVVKKNGRLHFTSLYRDVNYGQWDLHSRIAHHKLPEKLNEMKSKGLYPRVVNSYLNGEVPTYSIIFTEFEANPPVFSYGMTGQQYQTSFEEYREDGMALISISGVLGANKRHSYAAIWHHNK